MIKHVETSKYSGYSEKIVKNTINSGFLSLILDEHETYQSVLGFGGAFTEASAYTLSQMSEANKALVLRHYFDQTHGLGYNLGRMAMNSCDFALENYTYVKDFDETLESFDISREFKWVIPMIKDAEKVRGDKIKLLISPWSPPAWMKSNHEMNHGGKLLKKYYGLWAQYFIKFLDALEEAGLTVFALTIQNEPAATQVWDSCIYTAEDERNFIKEALGPALKASKHKDTWIIIWDHNRDIVVERAKGVLEDKEANQYVWGTGIHWYVSEAFENLSIVHDLFPDKGILFTEGCIEGGVRLNAFESGERYMRNMIGDFSHYCEGYIDWNLTLNEIGGPNHVGNYCDAPIICDTKTDTVYINKSYDAIGHFSKYVQVGAKRIKSTLDLEDVNQVAFINPDGSLAIIIQNPTEKDIALNIQSSYSNGFLTLSKRSMSTIVIKED
ncbi:MAG: glycoside hydrolase family 30 protein [Candidatus Izemoplasmataceae bacterium]